MLTFREMTEHIWKSFKMFRVEEKSHLHLQCAAHFLNPGMYYGLVVWTILQNIPLPITLGIIRP